jgi:hypothetical protein
VIEIADRAGKHDDLIRYLQTFHEPKIDAELAYSYAKTDGLHDIEELGFTNVADALDVGKECFDDELYQAIRFLFPRISNWARLATTLTYLGKKQAAAESAWKAGNTGCITGSNLWSQRNRSRGISGAVRVIFHLSTLQTQEELPYNHLVRKARILR